MTVQDETKSNQQDAVPVTTATELVNDSNVNNSTTDDTAGAIPTITLPSPPVQAVQSQRMAGRGDDDEDDLGTVVATVKKPAPDAKIGINMRKGRDGGVYISSFSSRGLLAQSPTELQQSMRIIMVNDVDVRNKQPTEVKDILAGAEEEITIVAEATPLSERSSIRLSSARSVALDQELAQARERETNAENKRQRERCCEDCCFYCDCFYCPLYCDPHSQYSCGQSCCICCESGCSALDNGCDGCDSCCDVCGQSGCEAVGCCFSSCFSILGAVSV